MQNRLSTFNFRNYYIVIIIVLCFGYIFQWIFENKIILSNKISATYKINRIISENHVDEVPIVGSSRAEGTFIPSLLGKNFYNYGISGIRDNVIIFFLKEECKKNKHTPILINFDMEGFSNSIGDQSNYILNSNNLEIKNLLDSSYQSYYAIPIIKYYGNYMFYLKEYLNSRIMLTKYQNSGANIEKNILTKEKFQKLVLEREKTKTYFQNNSQLENQFLHIFKSNPNRKFILIIPPYHKSYFKQYYTYSKVNNFFNSLDKYQNVAILNYSKLKFDDSLFFNTTHLNLKGALKFNKLFKVDLDSLILHSK